MGDYYNIPNYTTFTNYATFTNTIHFYSAVNSELDKFVHHTNSSSMMLGKLKLFRFSVVLFYGLQPSLFFLFRKQVTSCATWVFTSSTATAISVTLHSTKVTASTPDVMEIDVLCHKDLYLYVGSDGAFVGPEVISCKWIPARIQPDELLPTEIVCFAAIARHHQGHVMCAVVAIKIAKI